MTADPSLALRIKRARERLGLTQQQLADRIGRDRKTVDNWENSRTIPRSSMGALEAVLGSLSGTEPDPREEELRDLGEDRGGFLPAAEVDQLIGRYRQRKRKRPPDTRAG